MQHMQELNMVEVDEVSGGEIKNGGELAAGLIFAAGCGMVGGLLGAIGGPVTSAGLAVTFARAGFAYVEAITSPKNNAGTPGNEGVK